jgi:hypothetical protein
LTRSCTRSSNCFSLTAAEAHNHGSRHEHPTARVAVGETADIFAHCTDGSWGKVVHTTYMCLGARL